MFKTQIHALMGTFHIQASCMKEDMAAEEENTARKQVRLQSIIGKHEKSRGGDGSSRLGKERRAGSPGTCGVD